MNTFDNVKHEVLTAVLLSIQIFNTVALGQCGFLMTQCHMPEDFNPQVS